MRDDGPLNLAEQADAPHSPAATPEPYLKLLLRFLRFGALAWGGPVAQIAMIRQELVDQERWISNERFNRILAVYQVLPGPEATELCVYFGMQARGRVGGLLAGVGFVMPGFVLMLILSWLYTQYGMNTAYWAGAFYGMQAVVGALIVRAIHRIAGHALYNRWLGALALLGVTAQLVGIPFGITLLVAGGLYALVERSRGAAIVGGVLAVSGIVWWGLTFGPVARDISASGVSSGEVAPALGTLFASGLRGGLLTFGGAYTVIPFLQNDAVVQGGWMTNAQFLDGLALSGILPAPLVIVGTFVGYLGGGFGGALAVTLGIFLPAFAFTLVGHDLMERLIAMTGLHRFLDGVTAAVVGLIIATTLLLLRDALQDGLAVVIFGVGLFLLYRWKSTLSVPLVVLLAALVGWGVMTLG